MDSGFFPLLTHFSISLPLFVVTSTDKMPKTRAMMKTDAMTVTVEESCGRLGAVVLANKP